MGQITAVGRVAFERGRQLDQDGQEPTGLHQWRDAVTELDRFVAPAVGIDFVGHGAGQLGGKAEIGRHLGEHAFHGRGPGHLVPGVVELGHAELPGIERQHLACRGARRIEAGIAPFRVGVSAGAHPQRACRGCVERD